MPAQKDLKRLVRSRMKKTGEAYTAARFQLLKNEPKTDYAKIAGMTDSAVSKQTGRTWAEWVGVLDAVRASEKPHRHIAEHVSSLGTPDWWSQMITVGYEDGVERTLQPTWSSSRGTGLGSVRPPRPVPPRAIVTPWAFS